MTFTNKFYDVAKQIALVWLPAIATLYTAIAGIWGLEYVTEVVGSISAVDTFLGVVLHLSSSSYKPGQDGQMVVDTSNPAKDVYSLELTTEPEALAAKKSITLQVINKG